MTKLVKNLIIGGTSTVVVTGGGTAIALSLTKKKASTADDQTFVLKQQEDIAQAKLELEKLQAKLNAATTSEELIKVEQEVKEWLERNTSNINEMGEDVEKKILEAEKQKEQEIIWAEHQKQDAEYERLQAEREKQEAAFKTSTNAEEKGTFTTFQLEGTITAPTAYVKPAYKEGVVIATPELQAAPMLIPNLVPAIHPQKTPTLVFEVQQTPSLMVTGERGEVVATQEFAFEGFGQLVVPEPVTGETPVLVPTQLATSDKAPFITPNPVDDQVIPMVVPKVVNDQLIPMPIPVAGEMVVPFAVPTQLATSDKAPFITPNPVNDQVIPMVVPKITEPQLIPQATPVKLPQVEVQIPPLYVQGIIGGFSAERQELVATHELAFEGAQTLEQFAASLKESSKATKEDAKQLAFETTKAKDAHKSAKLDAKEALRAASLAKAAELDKQFEAKQAALEQRKAVAELNSRVDHGVGTVEVKAPYGQVVAPIVYATPSLTQEAQDRLQAEDKQFELEQAAREQQVATSNAKEQTPFSFGTFTNVEGTLTYKWQQPEYVTPTLTQEAQDRLQAEDKQFELEQAAREQQVATSNAKEQTPFSFGTFTNVEGTLTYKWQQPEYVTPTLTPEGEVNAAIAFAATAEQGHNVNTQTPVRHELTEDESKALDAKLAANIKAMEVQSQSPVGIDAKESIDRETSSRALAIQADLDRIATEARLEQEAKEFAATAAQGQGVDTLTPVRHELTDVETFALDAQLAANLKAREVQSQSPIGIISQERIDRETNIRAAAVEAAQKWMIEEQKRIAIQAELDRLVAEQEAKEAAYAAQFGSSFYSPAYNNFMTGIFTDYEKLAKEYELQSVTNENQRWLGDLFATRFSTPVPRAQAMLDQLAKMTGTLDRNQAGFLGQQLVNEIYGRTDVAGIRIAVTNGNIEVTVVGPNGLNPDSVIETAKIPYTVMPTTASAALNPVQSIAAQLADNPQDFKQVVVEQVAQQFKDMIAQTVNGNSINQFGIQNFAFDIMSRLANDIKGSDVFHLVSVEENAVEHFRTVMQNAHVDRNVFIAAMQQAIQVKVRQAFERINMQTIGWRLIGSFGSMDNFLSSIISSIQSMY